MNQYKIQKLLGKGAYGNVYKAIDVGTGTEYASPYRGPTYVLLTPLVGIERILQKPTGETALSG